MALPTYVHLTFQRVVGQLEVEKDGHTEVSDYSAHAAFVGCFIKELLINWPCTVGYEWKGEYEHLSFSPVLLKGEQYGPFLFFPGYRVFEHITFKSWWSCCVKTLTIEWLLKPPLMLGHSTSKLPLSLPQCYTTPYWWILLHCSFLILIPVALFLHIIFFN